MLQALPFLALGLGVDDLFLLLHAFKSVCRDHAGKRAELLVALTLAEAGSSVTITSACNCAVFGLSASFLPIVALQNMLGAAAIVVAMNWIAAIALIPSLLAVYAKSLETADAKDLPLWEGVLAEKKLREEKRGVGASSASLVERFYFKFAKSLPLRLTALALGLGVLLGFSCLIPEVEFGYKMEDFAKRNSFLGRGIREMYDQARHHHQQSSAVSSSQQQSAAVISSQQQTSAVSHQSSSFIIQEMNDQGRHPDLLLHSNGCGLWAAVMGG